MTTTLRYIDELLAAAPDNTTGLILAETLRDFIASFAPGAGGVVSTSPIIVPIVDGVWVDVSVRLVAAETYPGLWVVDGNNYLSADYSPLASVPAGYSKVAELMAIIGCDKTASGSDDYLFAFTKNGAAIPEFEPVTLTATPQIVTLINPVEADVSEPTDTYGVSVQGNGTSDNINITYFGMQVVDRVRLTAPAP